MIGHYLRNGQTLVLDAGRCNGCRQCVEVCPHEVFVMTDGRAAIRDGEACMECGACMKNCPRGALRVKAGVGCAAAVLNGLIRGTEASCGCGGPEASGCCGSKETGCSN